MCFLQSEGESMVSGGGVVRWGAKGGEGGEEEGRGGGGGLRAEVERGKG